MKQTTKLYKNLLIYSIGNFGSRILTFLMFPVYSYYLSTDEYGRYDLITTTIALVLPLLTLQIPESIMKFVVDEKKEIVLKTSLVMCGCSTLIFGLIGVVISEKFNYSFLILVWLELQLINTYLMQTARALAKNKVYSFCSLLSTIVTTIVTLVLLVKFKLGINALIWGGILSSISGIIFLEIKCDLIKWLINKTFSTQLLKKMLRFSIPLIPTSIIWWIMNSSDKYVISYFLGQSANGIYAISYKFPTIITIIYSFYNMAWQDHVLLSKNKVDFENVFAQFKNFIIYMSIVVMYGAKFVTIYMVNSTFQEAYLYIPPLIVGMVFYCFSGFFGIVYRKNSQTQKEMFSSVIGAISNILINIVLIKMIGLFAAALSTMISFVIVLCFRYGDAKKYFKIKEDYFHITKMIILYSAFIAIYYYNNNFISLCMMILSLGVFVLKNKNMLYDFLAVFQRK